MKKIIGFVTAGLDFNGNSINEKALGGSESAMIYMARELAKADNIVIVYCTCDKIGVYDGVVYFPLDEFYKINTKTFDVLVVSRTLEVLNSADISNYTVFWMHDTYVKTFPSWAHLVDKIFLLSEFQKSLWVSANKHYAPMIHLTSNGFDSELANATPILPFADKKNNYIYASRPERGLKYLLKDIWPSILKKNPEAQLSICHYDNPVVKSKFDQLIKDTPNVTMLGELTKPEYYRALGQHAFMVYPCNFPEISCINAIEAQAMGCLVISTDDYALSETVKTPTLIKGPVGKKYFKAFVEKVQYFQDANKFNWVTNLAKEAVFAKYPWEKIAKDWDSYFDNAFEERYAQFKPQIHKHLAYNSDYSTLAKIDPTFDPTIIPSVSRNNLVHSYTTYAYGGIPVDAKEVNQLEITPRHRELLLCISNHIAREPNKKLTILDVGSYDGGVSGSAYKAFSDNIEKVIAYDGLQDALDAFDEIWKKNPECQNIEYICDDIVNLPKHNLKADIIIVSEVLEHIFDYKKSLEDVRRCANPGALVLFSTPTGPWSSIGMKADGLGYHADQHLHHFEFMDLITMFDGFDIDNEFFIAASMGVTLNYRNDFCSNYIFGFYNNNPTQPFNEYDPLLKAKKTRPYFSISTCLIVKNEENNLFRCLNSIKSISDEIIVVDTGSTDSSKEICRRFTDNVYDLKWEEEDGLGNFARARNYSLEKATGDWIFYIDADEELKCSFALADRIRSPYITSCSILQKQIMIGGQQNSDQHPDRLFRRGALQFYGVIHELPKQDPIKENELLHTGLLDECRLNHLGYLDSDLRKDKVKRNHRLLLKNIEKYPDLLDNHVYLIRDMVFFYQIKPDIAHLEKALTYWKQYPQKFDTFKELTFWMESFRLMQLVYEKLQASKKMKFLKMKSEDTTLLFASKEEFTTFQKVCDLHKEITARIT